MTPRPRRLLRTALGVGGALVFLVLAAAPAQAHARVVRTTPANGATVNGHIASISVVFDDPVRVVPRSLVVSGATGAPEPIGAPRVIAGKTLEATLPGRLPAGRYFVGWRILSDDGHIESGSFGFAVAAAGAAASAPAAVGTSMPAPSQPTWPIVVAAVMAGAAVIGAALVVVRGLAAVRRAAVQPYPGEPVNTASTREHALTRR
jgi:methionine-rich copper-binding protein CopC